MAAHVKLNAHAHKKCQNVLTYTLLFKLKSKYESFKINYCVNYLQLSRLVTQVN